MKGSTLEETESKNPLQTGGSVKFIGTMSVIACIPKVGYVGVGIVEDEVVPIKDFQVVVDEENIPLLEADLQVSMDTDVDDPDLCEYVVRVNWLKTVPKHEAIWEKGMFANQNSACKLRNQFTIETLTEHFQLDEES
ncbi:hypothetical protein NYE54_05510 [Paenibacillus sp. FSL K6-1330]|uniref:hypothetical protein n=1 Tax=Paenibacillus sp. FSL K6-1330 TaxID=2975292 RepID=UPI0030DD6307